MKTNGIGLELLRALGSLKEDVFTAVDLAQVYLLQQDRNRPTKRVARQFVYRNLERLKDTGLIERLPDSGRWPKYQRSKEFHHTSTPSLGPHLPSQKLVEQDHQRDESSSKQSLNQRLAKCRSEMLCAIGEAEEYLAMCDALPGLAGDTQTLYNEARERSAILLGNIKALENIIALLSD